PARFSTPAKVSANDGPWDAQSDADYNNVLLSSDPGYLGLSVEFAGGEDNNGTEVPSSWTRIGTLRLTITDASQSSGLSWRQISTVTQVFRLTNPGVSGGGSTDITSLGTFIAPSDAPLPVELSSFSVNSVEGAKAQLQWETATEVNNYGFEVERSIVVEDSELENEWEMVAFVEGHGNSNSPKIYSFTDKSLVGGSKFMYRLKQIDIDGTFEYTDAVEVEVLPTQYELFQNYPNPFNPSTNIKFSLPEDTKLAINIYNLLGERVATVLNEELKAGFHQIEFNSNSAGYSLASGVYIYSIESNNFSKVKKMILMK
ncbi:MAG: T9SS type A sorting domain-containing protein, partial [Melioribacteraceae bacterium]|nr:T9SS type A sorting domain-containing protein [Melioribacteraceae bacterium]